MVGEGRRRALVDEHAAGAEAVPAATGRGVVDRQAGAVVAMEPAEGYPGQARVAGLAGHLPRGDERHHQRRGVQWLLVTGFRRLRALGVVGEINYHPFDRDGELIDRKELRPLTQRVLAVPPSRLRELSDQYGKLVIAVAGGPDKHEAILGAMRGRFANVLVTDEETAEALLAASE